MMIGTSIYRSGVSLKLFACAILAVALLALAGARPVWAAETTFEAAQNSPFAVSTTPTTVTNADFNGDGKADLAAQNAGSNNVSVSLGNGDGTFQPKQDLPVGLVPTSVTSANFNADGIADLAVANSGSNPGSVSVLLGQDANGDGKGDGTFERKPDFVVGPSPSSVISADFNADGISDLAVANSAVDGVGVFMGQDLNGDGKGDGTFKTNQTQPFSINPPCSGDLCAFENMADPNQVIAADLNGDDKVDIATANLGRCGFFCNPGGVSVLLGNGDGTFQTPRVPTKGTPIPSISAAHLNAGTSVDLVAAEFNNHLVRVMSGNGDGTFPAVQQSTVRVGFNPSAVAGSDLDRDAKADDLAVSNLGSDNVSVLLNNDTGSFQPAGPYPAGDGPVFVIGADLNADGFADLAVANQNSNNISVLLNTVDTTAPAAPAITGPPEASLVSGSFVVSGTAEAGSTVELFEGTAFRGTTRTASSGSWSVPLSGVAGGGHTYTAKAKDAAGNTSVSSNPRTVVVDATAPAAPVITGPANNSYDTDGNVTLSGTAEANSTVEVFDGPVSRGTTSADASGNWSKALNGVAGGEHTYTAKAKDAVGNTSVSSTPPLRIIVDKTAPAAPIITRPGQDGLVNVNFTVSGTAEAGSTVELFEGTTSKGTAPTDITGNWSMELTGVADGSHSYIAKATDSAGNVSNPSDVRTVEVDATAPRGRVTINGGAAYTRTAAVSLALSASDAGSVSSMRFSNDGLNWTVWGPFTTSKAWALAGANGTKTVHVQYRDQAGNVSAPARDTIVFDNTPPTVSGMSPKNASIITDTTPTIRAIVRDNLTNLQKANMKLYVNGTQISPTKFSYSAATDELVYNSPRLAKGKKTIKIVATDAAGNVRTASWYFTIR